MYKNIIYILLIIGTLASCVTQRNVEYLKSKDELSVYADPATDDYKLQPNDELYIQIKSLDDPATNIFEKSSGQSSGAMSPYSASLTSYLIDKKGFVQLPVLGYLNVENKTLLEVSSMLEDSMQYILSEPTVIVRLVNKYVSVLGEVAVPGYYSYSEQKLTIFDALGLAGDVTEYGNRKKVILVRNESNENKRIEVDLTDPELMASEYYYLRPNDLVYVKPLRKKFWGMRQFPLAQITSIISTTLLLYSVFGDGFSK
ncbi:polysaccharide biosynthesis/export family protein [Saccharicrinis sp. FJH54]|uniref:polysaccharide biosynthesis/export family protein n=1 Tax=Saccharicrinis sp. FJH54 TaxID=3344665 RepID=UPI0035D3F5B9